MVTRVGLQLPATLTYETWEQAGYQLSRLADSGAWCLGDWMVFGESRYPDRYKRAVENAGIDYQTIRNYAWVARRFPASLRREGLSFQHHAEVAALPAEKQDAWLQEAERNRWSRNELRKRVRESRRGTAAAEPSTAVVPRIAVAQEHIQRWQSAARAVGQDLTEWIVTSLDAAATRHDEVSHGRRAGHPVTPPSDGR